MLNIGRQLFVALRIGVSRPLVRLTIASVAFTIMTAVMTAPFSWRFSDHLIPHNDNYLHVWMLAWTAHQLAEDPVRLFEANILYPAENTLALGDPMPLISFAAAPFIWAGVHPVAVHNALILLAFVVTGVGIFVLAFELTAAMAPSLVAGIIFTFASQRFAHIAHLELLWACWMPLALWALYRLIKEGRLLHGFLLGAFVGLQGLSSLYYFVFLGTYLLVIGLASIDRAPAELWKRRVAGLLLAGATLAVLLGPYLVISSRVGTARVQRSEEAVAAGSATLRSYARVLPENRLYFFLRRTQDSTARSLFPGALAVLLAAIGIWKGPRRPVIACTAGLAFALLMSLGTNGWLFPAVRTLVPPLQLVRAPSRFGILVQMSIAVLAAMGAAKLLGHGSRRRVWVAPAIVAVLLLEYASKPMAMIKPPLEPPQVARWLASREKGSATVILPMHQWRFDPRYEFLSIYHWQPLVNGYSGYTTPSYMTSRDVLVKFPSAPAVQRLRDLKVSYVVLNARGFRESRYLALLDALQRHPDFGDPVFFDDPAFPSAVFTLR